MTVTCSVTKPHRPPLLSRTRQASPTDHTLCAGREPRCWVVILPLCGRFLAAGFRLCPPPERFAPWSKLQRELGWASQWGSALKSFRSCFLWGLTRSIGKALKHSSRYVFSSVANLFSSVVCWRLHPSGPTAQSVPLLGAPLSSGGDGPWRTLRSRLSHQRAPPSSGAARLGRVPASALSLPSSVEN